MNSPTPVPPTTVFFYPDGRMDTRNTATYTGFAEKTLAMKRCDGTGPRFVKRGRVFYFKDDVDAWLQAANFTSTAQAANHGRSAA
jgi:hypothetical protein